MNTTMKRFYQKPDVRVVFLGGDKHLAQDFPISPSGIDEPWVKEELTDDDDGEGASHNGYNVWADDWSQSIW